MSKSNQKSQTQFVDLDNAREDEQKQVMEKIIEAGECPFCLENLDKYNQQEPMKVTDYWLLTQNKWPYKNTKLHLLAIYKHHATDLAGLNPEAGSDLFKLAQWIETEYDVLGGGIAIRFGDTDYSAGTVNHLHAHFIVPDINNPNYSEKPVKFKIGKYKK